ncbi:MAG: HIT domain-containing protein [Planctomycetaceae bacterium]|nr:HIT domain-containing protein [Planctomycetaceae bacterium]
MSREQLWAPWRLNYILQPKEVPAPDKAEGCFFCRYRDNPADDIENYVLARTEHSMIVFNRFPYNNGHLLIAPLAHKAGLSDLSETELIDGTKQLQRMTAALQSVLTPDGFNVGLNLGKAAGAGVPGHLHWHIVPRWNGDTNFMAVLGDVNVIPQSLRVLYDYLKPRL